MIQCQILNKIIADNDTSILVLNNLDKSFFSDYQNEFLFIKNHLDEYGNAPDQATFLAKFPNFDILEVKESNKYLTEELFKDKRMRSLVKTFNSVKGLLQERKIDEAMALYLRAAEDMTDSMHMECIDIISNTEARFDSFIEKSNDFSKHYIRTGFRELDDVIGGWDRNEELATIIARPNVGKSWILLKVAIAAAEQGLTVGLYSGEMSEKKVGYRFDTLFGHLSNTKIIHGNRDIQNDYKQFLDSLKDKIPGKIKVITPAMIGGTASVTALRAFIEKEKLDILCIDQHSLLEDDKHAKNPVERAANISWDLKKLQVMKKIPIIAVSQANRAIGESGELGLENIAQSDRIGQDSTVVIGLSRKETVLSLHLLKSRDSVNNKTLKYAIDLDKGIFEFVPFEDDAKGGSDCQSLANKYGDYDSGGDEF